MGLLLREIEVKYLYVNSKLGYLNKIFFLDATIYVGGLDDKVSESLLWELFVQAGPLGNNISHKCDLIEVVLYIICS